MIDVILQIMNAFLFDEFMLWIWGPWSLLAILNGYLIADGFDSVEEALAFLGPSRSSVGVVIIHAREFSGRCFWVGQKYDHGLCPHSRCAVHLFATGGVADWNRGGA